MLLDSLNAMGLLIVTVLAEPLFSSFSMTRQTPCHVSCEERQIFQADDNSDILYFQSPFPQIISSMYYTQIIQIPQPPSINYLPVDPCKAEATPKTPHPNHSHQSFHWNSQL